MVRRAETATLDRPVRTITTPDAECLAAGDQYLHLSLRAFAAAMLSDAQISKRIIERLHCEVVCPEDASGRYDAAWAVAKHCALMDVPLRKTIALLAYLSAEIPAWPEADDIAGIAEAAIAECAA